MAIRSVDWTASTFGLISNLVEMIAAKMAAIKTTRFGPASLLEIITGLSEDFIDSKADHKGEDGSAETLDLLIGALFGHLAARFHQESQRKMMRSKGLFKKTEVPIDDSALDELMLKMDTFLPEISEFAFTDSLVDGAEGPFWTLRDQNPKSSVNIGSWLRSLMLVQKGVVSSLKPVNTTSPNLINLRKKVSKKKASTGCKKESKVNFRRNRGNPRRPLVQLRSK